MAKELKVGFSGGHRSNALIKSFAAIEETRAVALCDPNEETLNRVAHQHGIEKRYTRFEEMVDTDLDIIVVASPMQFHVPQSVAALKSGKHVLSEVTAAVSLEECWELLEAVKKSGLKYMMAENLCYLKSNMLIRNMVKAGLFGEIYFGEGEYIHDCKSLHTDREGNPTWRAKWQVGRNGCTYGTHSLGPVLRWFGERVETVCCLGTGVHTSPTAKMEDAVIMLCKLESGALVKIRVDMLSNRPHNMTYYSLQGTKGCYEAPRGFGDEHKVWLADYSEDPQKWQSLWNFEDYLPECWKNTPEAALKAGHWGGDYFEVRDFVDSILNNTTPTVDIYLALEWTAPGLCSEESINSGGKPVKVPNFRKASV